MTIFKHKNESGKVCYVNLERVDFIAENAEGLTICFQDATTSRVCPEDSARLRRWLEWKDSHFRYELEGAHS